MSVASAASRPSWISVLKADIREKKFGRCPYLGLSITSHLVSYSGSIKIDQKKVSIVPLIGVKMNATSSALNRLESHDGKMRAVLNTVVLVVAFVFDLIRATVFSLINIAVLPLNLPIAVLNKGIGAFEQLKNRLFR